MTDSTSNPSTLERVLTALAEHGPATAASIGESIGVAYSTTTPKLRELENAGHAERIRTAQRTTLWQLTPAGAAAAASITAGSTSTQTPPPTSASDDDQAGGESQQQQQATVGPRTAPQPDTAAPGEDQATGNQPADQQAPDPAAETSQASPPPGQASDPLGTAAQVAAPQTEPDPQPVPETDTDLAVPGSGATQDQPKGEPRADGRSGEVATDPTGDDADRAPAPAEDGDAAQERGSRPKPARRRKGQLRDEVLALLQRNPDTAYKIGEICKLINQANGGAPVNKASAGAVANALDKLVADDAVTQLDATVATYQAR
ncbi:hypothetical protein O7627_33365 [Solwaraspora sp. WMMD1047]|uniref:hypothetical protein n=1 Tax=Solwaraspora sp. WMMD1047 TaxID=3016102 RepID=UPI0024170F28|nr:hypothetical protein [Solwaraspora sp. WMMD1047]MDG4834156.1 hypothetical protein [Solwaraspora sp. WMMD1047]